MAKTKRRKTTLHAHPYYPQDKGKIERAIQKRNPRIHKPHQKIPPLAKQPPQQIQKPVQPPKNTLQHKNHTLQHYTPPNPQTTKKKLSFSQKPRPPVTPIKKIIKTNQTHTKPPPPPHPTPKKKTNCCVKNGSYYIND